MQEQPWSTLGSAKCLKLYAIHSLQFLPYSVEYTMAGIV